MGAFDGVTLSERFRRHFGHTDHLYGSLLAAMADDWEVGGVTRELFEGWEEADARQFPQLRLLAGLFRIVLRGDAPQLEGFYPALGGDLDHHEAWGFVRPVLAAHVEELRQSLAEAPQTNEPARSVALLVGMSEAVRRTGLRRVRLSNPEHPEVSGCSSTSTASWATGGRRGRTTPRSSSAGARPRGSGPGRSRWCPGAAATSPRWTPRLMRAPPTCAPSSGRGSSTATSGSRPPWTSLAPTRSSSTVRRRRPGWPGSCATPWPTTSSPSSGTR